MEPHSQLIEVVAERTAQRIPQGSLVTVPDTGHFLALETPQAKLTKLQQALAQYRFPQTDTLPLLAALLSLPHPESTPPITLSPQKQKTQEALVAWIVEEAEKAAVYCAWEDLHWADPSTLELLTPYLEQIPTTRVFTVLTFRSDFTPPWGPRSYFTQLTLSPLGRPQVEAMKEEAHQMLAEIYGWFTEGFDTKDLQEAKALLEELR